LTKNLKDLAAQAVRRLSGIEVETSPVFNMATQFGGGKTHALALLFHLARAGPKSHDWQGVRSILDQAGVKSVPHAVTAVFVGQKFDSIHGRGGEKGELRRLTPWGEIAWQLGGAKGLSVIAQHDAEGIAPGGDAIRAFLPEGPALILMDELVLSSLVSTPGLKLQVRFEVRAGDTATEAKIEGTKSALRELGLSEDIENR
jgi:predicted AAA+ superfamily ATPase